MANANDLVAGINAMAASSSGRNDYLERVNESRQWDDLNTIIKYHNQLKKDFSLNMLLRPLQKKLIMKT